MFFALRQVWREIINKPTQLTAIFFVTVITAVVLMVALEFRVDALLTIRTTEFVQRTRHVDGRPTVFLVLQIAAVEITIAFLRLGQTRTTSWTVHLALEVVSLTFSIR